VKEYADAGVECEVKELSLFTGAGGGLLGTKLLGFKHIGYVEINDYCQRIIAQRIKDGILDNAPIFTDIKAFIDSGCAELYRGITDVITGGFPCQDISAAGKGAGINGERSGLWQEMARVVCQVRPKYILVENSPMLSVQGLGTVLRDISQMGYDARWGVVSAENTGAPHKRERIWILAYPSEKRGAREHGIETDRCSSSFNGDKTSILQGETSNSNSARQQEQWLNFPNEKEQLAIKCSSWWKTEPSVGRVVDGMAFRVDRLAAIGNGQVPIVVKTVWELLT
jgi:DNA (cytosine-5)-methyltransferase 1